MNSFYSALQQANLLYDVSFTNEDDFVEIGLIAWNLIGNKRVKLYRYFTEIDCQNNTVELPCNADIIESVNIPMEDWNYSTNHTIAGDVNSFIIENGIEHFKFFSDPLFARGKHIPYERVGDTLYFDKNYGKIVILYKGIIVDDEGLPELTDSESLAIATYVAYAKKYKEGLMTNNTVIMNLALNLKKEWLTRCDQARLPEYLNQNDMNEILDAKSSWNRKLFRKSYHVFN